MTAKEELAGRLTDILADFHRNSCYPEALRFELEFAVEKIVAALTEAGAGEAVAWRWTLKDIPDDWRVGIGHPQLPEARFLIEPLYASPPPVQPVVKAASPIAPAAPSAPAGDWKANSHWYDMYCVARDEIAALTAPPSPAPGGTEATSIIREMVRLADMGFEASLREPQENGNFAVYERAKRYLAAIQPVEQPDDLRAEIERLRAELDEFKASNALKGKAFAKASARVKALEEGLEPFAHIAKVLKPEDGWSKSDSPLLIEFDDSRIAEITLSCFWAARALLDKPGGE